MTAFSVRIDERVSSVAEQLAGLDQTQDQATFRVSRLFPTMAESLVFGALIGFGEKRKVEIENPRKNPIASHIFESAQLQGYVYLIAVAETESLDIVKDERLSEAVRIFEEYANGGFFQLLDDMEAARMPLFESVLNRMTRVAAELTKASPKSDDVKIIVKKRRSISRTE